MSQTSLPTHAEAESLLALIPKIPHPEQDMGEVLNEMFKICETPFIRKFLFTSDQIQLPHLTSSNFERTAVTASLVSTYVESREATSDTLSEHLNSSVVAFPAISTDDVTLGFYMNEFIHSPGRTWDKLHVGIPMLTESRYAWDHAENVFLIVLQAPEADITIVDYTRLIGSTQQKRHVVRFSHSRFRSFLASEGVITAQKIMPLVLQLQTMYERRNCPFCQAPHGVCHCRIRMKESDHPYDAQAFMQNILLFVGSFEGAMNATVCNDGGTSRRGVMGCRFSVIPGLDYALMRRLQKWAVRTNSRGANPLQGMALCGTLENSLRDCMLVEGVAENAMGGDRDEPSGRMTGHVADEEHGISRVPTSPRRLPQIAARGSDGSQVGEQRAGVPISSRGSAANHQGSASGDNTGHVPVRHGISAERMEILRKRRERNRASAKRSNLQKKELNEELKRQLDETRQRVRELREREMALRLENMRLRDSFRES